jgi:hypothetical protein
MGADEVYIAAQDLRRATPPEQYLRSRITEGVDTGNLRSVAPSDRCLSDVYVAVDRNGNEFKEGFDGDEAACTGSASIEAMFHLWEKEGGQSPFDSNGPQPSPGRTNLDSRDELIGSTRARDSSAELRTILDERGEAFGWNEDLRINGHYRVTFVITRVT